MISTKVYKELSKENILNEVSGYDLFKYYIKDFEDLSRSFCSPLRVDKNPDVRIFKSSDGNFLYKDFGRPEHIFDPFSFIMELYNISFVEALELINVDFNLNLGKKSRFKTVKNKPILTPADVINKMTSEKSIRVVSKPYSWYNLLYWEAYNITKSTLEKFRVVPIEGYYLNYNYFKCKKDSYAYCFGNYKYKILQSKDEFKWISNTSHNTLQGWRQLPLKGDLLFITSSLKDVMVFNEIGYNAVAPHSEVPKINQDVINNLKKRFKEIIIFYDNDGPGIDSASKLSEYTGFKYLHIPTEFKEKDPSDVSKRYGLDKLKLIIDSII